MPSGLIESSYPSGDNHHRKHRTCRNHRRQGFGGLTRHDCYHCSHVHLIQVPSSGFFLLLECGQRADDYAVLTLISEIPACRDNHLERDLALPRCVDNAR